VGGPVVWGSHLTITPGPVAHSPLGLPELLETYLKATRLLIRVYIQVFAYYM